MAGVDLIRSRRGPLILEVNASPGLEGIEAASGVDIAGAIIEYVDRSARRKLARAKAEGGERRNRRFNETFTPPEPRF